MDIEIDIKDILKAMWKKKVLIIVLTILFAVIGFAYYKFKNNDEVFTDYNTTYIASNAFKLGMKEKIITVQTEDGSEEKYYISDGFINESNYCSYILGLQTTLDEINEKNDIDLSLEEWDELISFSEDTDSGVLSISFEYSDEDVAIAVVDELTNILSERIEKLYSSTYKVYPITMVQETTAEEKDVATVAGNDCLKIIIVFAIIGFIFGTIIIVIKESLNDTIKDEEELEKITNLNTLAVIKNENDLKMLRVNTNNYKSMLITSVSNIEARNNIAIGLAKEFTKLGRKTLLIDLSNENNNLAKKPDNKGLTDFLKNDNTSIEKYIKETSMKDLQILSLGNNTELLESEKMVELLKNLEEMFDNIIITSENILENVNTLVASKIIKNTIIVLKNREDKLPNVLKAKKELDGNIIGTVLYE